MSFNKWPTKDPEEVLDYEHSFIDLLPVGDAIATSVFSVVSGNNGTGDLTIESESNTTTSSLVWLSGGVSGVTYLIGCIITTIEGRTFDRTIQLKVATL